MAAEQDPSVLSIYRLNVDGRDIGKFRSSGVLFSTGTGSTGWLYSARQITAREVNNLKHIIGLQNDHSVELIDYKMAKKISQQTVYPPDSEKIYYFVREGFQETNISEGFCSNLLVTNEMLRGMVKIDGHTTIPIGMGDQFSMKIDPKHHLRCLKLII